MTKEHFRNLTLNGKKYTFKCVCGDRISINANDFKDFVQAGLYCPVCECRWKLEKNLQNHPVAIELPN